jgi:hypothetical protein
MTASTGYVSPQVGDIVTYAEFGTPRRYTVAALADCGLRVRLDDGLGDIGFAVNAWECTLVERPAAAAAVEQPTPDSPDFPEVGSEMPWTRSDGHVTITVRRAHFTYTVETYQGGTYRVEDNCGAYATEAEARMVARGYAELYQAETPADEPTTRPVPEPRPAAKGTQTAVSDAQHVALAIAAADPDGMVRRGRGDRNASESTLRALARRGYLALVTFPDPAAPRRAVVVGGRITHAGTVRLAQLIATDAVLAEFHARLTRALAA